MLYAVYIYQHNKDNDFILPLKMVANDFYGRKVIVMTGRMAK